MWWEWVWTEEPHSSILISETVIRRNEDSHCNNCLSKPVSLRLWDIKGIWDQHVLDEGVGGCGGVRREQRNSKNCFLDCLILNSRVHSKYNNTIVSGATTLSFILLLREYCKILKTYQRFRDNKYIYVTLKEMVVSEVCGWMVTVSRLPHMQWLVSLMWHVWLNLKYTYPSYRSARITIKLCFCLGHLSPTLPEVCTMQK